MNHGFRVNIVRLSAVMELLAEHIALKLSMQCTLDKLFTFIMTCCSNFLLTSQQPQALSHESRDLSDLITNSTYDPQCCHLCCLPQNLELKPDLAETRGPGHRSKDLNKDLAHCGNSDT